MLGCDRYAIGIWQHYKYHPAPTATATALGLLMRMGRRRRLRRSSLVRRLLASSDETGYQRIFE
jgi:hypothetical protein